MFVDLSIPLFCAIVEHEVECRGDVVEICGEPLKLEKLVGNIERGGGLRFSDCS